jgi:hypothetical protein
LLARSLAAPELPGLVELTTRVIEPLGLADCWTSVLAGRLGLSFASGRLSAEETHRASALKNGRFAAGDHTARR